MLVSAQTVCDSAGVVFNRVSGWKSEASQSGRSDCGSEGTFKLRLLLLFARWRSAAARLRLKFDDPDKTWFYIDPRLGRVLARYQRRERLQRWIYHGLHSLDFSFWYYSRPAWDIGVIVLV